MILPSGEVALWRISYKHQRMMVDPMFIIVKNLRLLLTAVKPTGGAPTAVIL